MAYKKRPANGGSLPFCQTAKYAAYNSDSIDLYINGLLCANALPQSSPVFAIRRIRLLAHSGFPVQCLSI